VNRPVSIPLPPLLELSASQIEIAVQNADSQVDSLAGSVATLVQIGAEMCAHPDAAVAAQGVRITAEAQRAIIAMQFHDVLSQRLQHIRDGLAALREALEAPDAPPPEMLLAAIRARYTMEDERRLFDMLLGHVQGAPQGGSEGEQEALRGSVELF